MEEILIIKNRFWRIVRAPKHIALKSVKRGDASIVTDIEKELAPKKETKKPLTQMNKEELMTKAIELKLEVNEEMKNKEIIILIKEKQWEK